MSAPKSTLVKGIVTILLFGALGQGIWLWFFCRINVRPNEMAVIVSKIGEDLPSDQILANEGQKGIQADVLGEGRHFRNPLFYSWEKRKNVQIAPGQVGIVTSKVGENPPPGEFLVEDHQKGIWKRVLGPGTYRMNPYGYKIEVTPAVSVPIGYAGVVTSLSGTQAADGEFATSGQKGVREDILQPGLYFLNPREFKVDVLEIGVSQVSMLKQGGRVFTKAQLEVQNRALEELNQNMIEQQRSKRMDYVSQSSELSAQPAAPMRGTQNRQQQESPTQQESQMDDMSGLSLNQVLEFPSRDGFQINIDMTLEFELHPKNIAWIFRSYGDLPAVLDKVIIPQLSSVARNKGSEFGARDFVAGEARSKFQEQLTAALKQTLEEKKIIVHNALIRQVEVPMQILEPIQQVGLAIEQNLTNKVRQETAKMLAQLNTESTLIDQRKQQVAEETKKLRAEIKADQERQVARIQGETQRNVAEIRKLTAGVDADRVRMLGEASADAFQRVEGEKAEGTRLKAKAFGDPEAYSLWEFASRLSPSLKLNIFHAGDGTLWTDLEKAGGPAGLGGAKVLDRK